MPSTNMKSVGNTALWLSSATFGVFFLNVLLGGPLGQKPWMNDVMEMLTLLVAVVFFVAGTLAREAHAKLKPPEGQAQGGRHNTN